MTMRPWPCARIVSHTALVKLAAPITCTSSTSRKSARSILAKLLSRRMPALLTRMSMRPHSASVASAIACTASASVTEHFAARACPPAARISPTTASAPSPRSFTTTFAPCRASSSACARPSPPPAPVTMAVLPPTSIMLSPLLLRSRSRTCCQRVQLPQRLRQGGDGGDRAPALAAVAQLRVGFVRPGGVVRHMHAPAAEFQHRRDVRAQRVADHQEARGRHAEFLQQPRIGRRVLLADDLDAPEQVGQAAVAHLLL